ncbi:TetR/AcrR family transcriptional regulator [Adhaeribacter pallidiroseus]|uniref:Putative HTH-type transcriptional regulator YfiR n=1 Tax=Adhaeribacter pallidiroseus TaxID=2072847 RepID=A0A369QDC1_9BACT|nr:TetR/AcrR family transcriptional regulator [Adhaeribacter pallidiroseus]RDC62330.1 putative HTH-type transcriptional regulator YfiR [Adhaeribacter pallidiroseus]
MSKKQKDQSTEQRILQAAKTVFIHKGMAGARMQDIADEAGINKAMLHYYFRSKEKLFEVIFREAISRFLPKVNATIALDCSLFEKIEIFCREYITVLMENPYIPLFIVDEANKQPYEFLKTMMGNQKPDLRTLIIQIEEEVKKGVIHPVSPAQLILNMMSMCIFPFLGRPIWNFLSGMDQLQFNYLMDQRKTDVAQFIINSIKK